MGCFGVKGGGYVRVWVPIWVSVQRIFIKSSRYLNESFLEALPIEIMYHTQKRKRRDSEREVGVEREKREYMTRERGVEKKCEEVREMWKMAGKSVGKERQKDRERERERRRE